MVYVRTFSLVHLYPPPSKRLSDIFKSKNYYRSPPLIFCFPSGSPLTTSARITYVKGNSNHMILLLKFQQLPTDFWIKFNLFSEVPKALHDLALAHSLGFISYHSSQPLFALRRNPDFLYFFGHIILVFLFFVCFFLQNMFLPLPGQSPSFAYPLYTLSHLIFTTIRYYYNFHLQRRKPRKLSNLPKITELVTRQARSSSKAYVLNFHAFQILLVSL